MLRGYGGKNITVSGTVLVDVQTSNIDKPKLLELHVVEGLGPSLMGRNWLKPIPLDWQGMFKVQRNERLERILANKAEVFSEALRTLRGIKASPSSHTQALPVKEGIICTAKEGAGSIA